MVISGHPLIFRPSVVFCDGLDSGPPLGYSPTMGGFQLVEHTADVGLDIWGDTQEDLFRSAACGLLSLLTDPDRVEPRVALSVTVEAPAVDLLLHHWLREILYHFSTRGFLASRVEFQNLSEGSLLATLYGEKIDPERHSMRTDLKAVTYHQLTVRQEADRWKARAILDV